MFSLALGTEDAAEDRISIPDLSLSRARSGIGHLRPSFLRCAPKHYQLSLACLFACSFGGGNTGRRCPTDEHPPIPMHTKITRRVLPEEELAKKNLLRCRVRERIT